MEAQVIRADHLLPAPSYEIRLSEVIAALSYALDITEGQPEGHAVRSCLIGMRVAEQIGLPSVQRSALFYALLLKDTGCSSNAAKVCALFGADDRRVKRELKTTDWTSPAQSFLYLARNVAPGGSPIERAMRVAGIGLQGTSGARHLVETRCERGAQIARMLGFPEATAEGIRTLDEHWDGRGQPDGLKGKEIPLLGRIVGLAQTAEVFFSSFGVDAAVEMAETRRGRWFDPALVDALSATGYDTAFWQKLLHHDPATQLASLEPEERLVMADEARLDRVAEAFARVIDAKSPWTYRHSEGVAEAAVGIGAVLGFSGAELRVLRRAALLHDIGKLGVSNMLLDKPGGLTETERAEMRRHPAFTQRILERVGSFRELASSASAHHERMDGRGYPWGLPAGELPVAARLLVVADVYDALSAERPYRPRMPQDEALAIMRRDVGPGLCPLCFESLEVYLEKPGVGRVGSPSLVPVGR